jgi:hypothetical protein
MGAFLFKPVKHEAGFSDKRNKQLNQNANHKQQGGESNGRSKETIIQPERPQPGYMTPAA